MTRPHEHPEFMERGEVTALFNGVRDHIDSRFDLLMQAQKQTADGLRELTQQVRETNAQVGKLQLWRARIEGQLQGMRNTAGSIRAMWLAGTAVIGTSATIIALAWAIAQRFI